MIIIDLIFRQQIIRRTAPSTAPAPTPPPQTPAQSDGRIVVCSTGGALIVCCIIFAFFGLLFPPIASAADSAAYLTNKQGGSVGGPYVNATTIDTNIAHEGGGGEDANINNKRFAVALTKRFAESLLQKTGHIFGDQFIVNNENDNNNATSAADYVEAGEEEDWNGDFIYADNSSSRRSTSADFGACLRDLKTIFALAELKEHFWARKLLDSWGKPPAGVYAGSLPWLGDFDECLESRPPSNYTRLSSFEPLFCKLGFTTAQMPDNIKPQPQLIQFPLALTVSFCVPNSCDATIMAQLITLFALPRARAKFPVLDDIRIVDSLSQCQKRNIPLDSKGAVAIGIFTVWGFFILVATIFDIVLQIRENDAMKEELEAQSPPPQTSSDSPGADESGVIMMVPIVESPELMTPVEDPEPTAAGTQEEEEVHQSPTLSSISTSSCASSSRFAALFRFIVCFSLYTNLRKLFATKTPKSETSHDNSGENLKCLNGLRVISLFWVILAHCYFFLQTGFDNLQTVFDMRKSFGHQLVLGSVLGVDTFFFLSGFLAYWTLAKTLNLYSDPKKMTLLRSLPIIYLNRYIRLTPPYLAMMIISICLWPYLSNGPMYYQQTDEYCVENWWTNLLYVNNIVHSTRMCVGWSWYLAVDMQLSIMAPFIVFLFQRWENLGLFLAIAALFCQAITAAILTWIYSLPSTLLPELKDVQAYGNVTFLSESFPASADYFWELTPESSFAYYFDMIYIKPLCWIAPYIVGLTTGYLIAKRGRFFRRHLSIKISVLLWLASFITIFALIYGQWGQYSQAYVTPPIAHALYNALSRTLWALAIGWIVMASVFDRAGPICRFLAWSGWAVPAKLAYTAYLIHPLLLIFYVQTTRRPIHATDTVMLWFFLGTVFITYLASILFSLVFESPVLSMQRFYVRPHFQKIAKSDKK